ncbi:MAG: efflux RND transporter periplasmic adaptor subunit [Desulfobacterales bacterium]|jgi:HlyD family secretion protein
MADTPLSVKETMQRLESSHRRKRFRRLLAGSGLLLIVTAAVTLWAFRGKADTVHFQTRPVRRGDLIVTVSATGNLEATNEVKVGSELSGIITSVTADYNEAVKVGQPLAYLDDIKFKAAVFKARAQVASARANYQEALATRNADEKTIRRYRKTRELTGGKMPSLEDLEQATAELERSTAAVAAAEAAIQIAEASLQSDEADLKKTVIYAPINGIVLSRDVEAGQTVAASLSAPVLYTLAEDLRRMELQVDVDEADVGMVKEGQPATFTVDAYPDSTFEAQITQVRYGAETTDGVVTYKAVLKVDNPDLLLRPGMTAAANIIVRKIQNTLLVPNSALRFVPSQPAQNTSRKRGLLRSLLPGPPRRGISKAPTTEESSASGDSRARLWVIKNGRPVPVAVQKMATDGALTAVSSEDLQEGMQVIVNAITAG